MNADEFLAAVKAVDDKETDWEQFGRDVQTIIRKYDAEHEIRRQP